MAYGRELRKRNVALAGAQPLGRDLENRNPLFNRETCQVSKIHFLGFPGCDHESVLVSLSCLLCGPIEGQDHIMYKFMNSFEFRVSLHIFSMYFECVRWKLNRA